MMRGLAVLLLCGVMVGCSGGSGGGNDRTTIQFWQFWPSDVITPVLADFEKAHPDIHVEMQQLTWQDGIQKITAAVASGTVPDVCELGSTWFAKYAAAGALRDLTPLADSLRTQYRAWEMCTYQSRVEALPWVVGTRALFYNKELFRRAGLDPEKPPRTWSELTRAAAAIDKLGGGIRGYGVNAGERDVLFKKFFPFAWGNGGNVLNPDGTRSVLHSQQNIDALRFYLSLRDHSLMERQELLDQAFKQGRIGMNLSGGWLFKTIPTDAPELQYGVTRVPKPDTPSGTHASFAGGELLVVFDKAKHADAALTLARYLVSPPVAARIAQAAKSVVPANIGAENDAYYTSHPAERVFIEQLATAVAPPSVPQWVDMETIINTALEEALYDKITPEEALRRADEQVTALLQSSGTQTASTR